MNDHRIGFVTVGLLLLSSPLFAQSTDDTTPHEVDDCGTLVRGVDCVLFEGGGGRYYLADYGKFRVGDTVRVVGTADPTCITICADADGCIRGAVVYDPTVYPCGTPIPSLGDLGGAVVNSICTAATGALGSAALIGMFMTRGRGVKLPRLNENHAADDKRDRTAPP